MAIQNQRFLDDLLEIGHSISPHCTKIINCSSGKQTAKVKLNSQLDIKYAFP